MFELFRLDPRGETSGPQKNRITLRLADVDYDLVIQTLPTAQGVSATIKLVNRATFLKDLTTLGLDIEDRVRLMEELRNSFGLVLVTAPVFNGANTTAYAIMNFLVRGQRDVVSLEAPVRWPVEGVRQVEVEATAGRAHGGDAALDRGRAARGARALRGARPRDRDAGRAARVAACWWSRRSPAQTAAQAVTGMLQMGVPPQVLAGCAGRRHLPASGPPDLPHLPPAGGAARAADARAPRHRRRRRRATLKFFRGSRLPVVQQGRLPRPARDLRGAGRLARGARGRPATACPPPEIEAIAVGTGMITLRERCLELVREGVTTFDEFTRLRL